MRVCSMDSIKRPPTLTITKSSPLYFYFLPAILLRTGQQRFEGIAPLARYSSAACGINVVARHFGQEGVQYE